MYFTAEPKYMFIICSVDYNDEQLGLKVKLSVPFFTKEDAEKYKNDFLNNLQDDSDELFAVIPLEPLVKK